MGNELLYDVQNISCQYKASHFPVLKLTELTIYKGQIYFIVGASGVGKSTILETLGIMNNTIIKNDNAKMNFHGKEGWIDVSDIWNTSERNQARFRKDYLSFIFQSTNLFLNLNAYENATVSQVLQGRGLAEARLKARQLLMKLYPKDFVIDIISGKKVEKMSGGQRQRLAFARALGTDYSVLFADEPTGNLDHHNAQKLLKILSDIVKNEKRTAVIVSHDIDLAVTYADKIVLIRKDSEGEGDKFHYFGIVDEHSVYEKKHEAWLNHGSKQSFATEDLASVLKTAIRDNQN